MSICENSSLIVLKAKIVRDLAKKMKESIEQDRKVAKQKYEDNKYNIAKQRLERSWFRRLFGKNPPTDEEVKNEMKSYYFRADWVDHDFSDIMYGNQYSVACKLFKASHAIDENSDMYVSSNDYDYVA